MAHNGILMFLIPTFPEHYALAQRFEDQRIKSIDYMAFIDQDHVLTWKSGELPM